MAMNAVTLFEGSAFEGKSVTLIHDANDLTRWKQELGGSVGSIRLYGTKIRAFTQPDWKGEGIEITESLNNVAVQQEKLKKEFASFYFVS
jgi:hypothetical protein